MYCKITPSAEAYGDYKRLFSEVYDPDAFMRSSGDTMVKYDTAWKTACVRKQPREVVDTAVADFMLIGSAHLDALAMNRLRNTAMATALSMLVSADMAKADTVALGLIYLELHARYLLGCVELLQTVADDSFGEPHAKAILRMESELYLGVLQRFKESYSPAAHDMARYEGIAEAACLYTQDTPRMAGDEIVADASAPSEALVDMFSRLHALGLQD